MGSWCEGPVKSKVVRFDEATDIQYRGVAENVSTEDSDNALSVDFTDGSDDGFSIVSMKSSEDVAVLRDPGWG